MRRHFPHFPRSLSPNKTGARCAAHGVMNHSQRSLSTGSDRPVAHEDQRMPAQYARTHTHHDAQNRHTQKHTYIQTHSCTHARTHARTHACTHACTQGACTQVFMRNVCVCKRESVCVCARVWCVCVLCVWMAANAHGLAGTWDFARRHADSAEFIANSINFNSSSSTASSSIAAPPPTTPSAPKL
jgi:hypothetical protein